MKLETLINPIKKSDSFQAKKYEIDPSPYAFQLLIKQLYKHPIKSIIRELISNAYDSHQQANNPAPVKVLFPSTLDPYFIVEDFGTGLSPEDINNIYTVLFRSNRRSSNDFIGGFGLGAKCPFSYTDHFLITSFYKNTEFQYAAIINADGIPEINLINELPTTRPNGLIIKVPVLRDDHSKFIYNGKEILSWFPNLETNIEIEKPFLLIDTPKFSVSKKINYSSHGAFALIQNVIYPLDLQTIFKPDYFATYKWQGSLILKFQIGELSITPNREDLNYNEKTIQILKDRYNETKKEVQNIMQQNIITCPTYEQACKKYIHHYLILNSWDWWDTNIIYHIGQPKTPLSKYITYTPPNNLKITYIPCNRKTRNPSLQNWKDSINLDLLEKPTIYWAPEKHNYIKERLYKAYSTISTNKTNLLIKGGDKETITKIFNDLLLEPITLIDLTDYNYIPQPKYQIKNLSLKTINCGPINPNDYYQNTLYYVQMDETRSKTKKWTLSELYNINYALTCITDKQIPIVQLQKYRWSIPSKLNEIYWIDLEKNIEDIFSSYLNEHLKDIQKHQIINQFTISENIRTFLKRSYLSPHLIPDKDYDPYITALNLLKIEIPKNPTLEKEIKTFVTKYETLITERVYNSDIIQAYTFYKEHNNA